MPSKYVPYTLSASRDQLGIRTSGKPANRCRRPYEYIKLLLMAAVDRRLFQVLCQFKLRLLPPEFPDAIRNYIVRYPFSIPTSSTSETPSMKCISINSYWPLFYPREDHRIVAQWAVALEKVKASEMQNVLQNLRRTRLVTGPPEAPATTPAGELSYRNRL